MGLTPALSPGLAAQWAPVAVAEDGTEEAERSWMGTGPLELWLSGVYCDCIAKDAGGGWRIELGVASGTHPDLRGLQRCQYAALIGGEGGSHGI